MGVTKLCLNNLMVTNDGDETLSKSRYVAHGETSVSSHKVDGPQVLVVVSTKEEIESSSETGKGRGQSKHESEGGRSTIVPGSYQNEHTNTTTLTPGEATHR